MEAKKEIKIEDKKSNIILENRRRLVLTGVIEIFSFDDEKISLNTNQGLLNIKGQELKISKLDVQSGEAIIIGLVDSCIYSTNSKKADDKESILSKLFK